MRVVGSFRRLGWRAFAYTDIFANHYNRFFIRPSLSLPATPRRMPQ
jgi:hypothetical protein